MKRFLPALLQTLVLAIGSPLAAAQDYPSKADHDARAVPAGRLDRRCSAAYWRSR